MITHNNQLRIFIMRPRSMIALSVAIITQIYYLVKGYMIRQKKNKLIQRIKALKVCSPKEIINTLKLNDGNLQQFLCLGKLFAGEPCHAVLNPTINVTHSRLYEGQFQNRVIQKRLLRISQPSYLKLKGQNEMINIYQAHQATIMATRVMKMKDSWLGRIKNLILSFFRLTKKKIENLQFTEFYQPQKVFQLYVPQGNSCTVLGDFVKEGQQIVCSRPKMIFPDKKKMLQFIEGSVSRLNRLHVLLTLSFGICFAILAKEIYLFIRKQGKRPVFESPFSKLRKIFVKKRVCTACNKNLSCVYNIKCEHMVVCQECLPKPDSYCLECNEKQNNFVQMFVC